DYATFLYNFYTPKNILICLLIAIVASFIGAYFGIYIYNKFFSDRKKKSVL
ncbi:MptD family putative ECF transporter S component, partial [Filifactor alocis]|uniref:MptD family putative ECF transporter S component n=1 Tax=Filifactor alocis TaxID=143361 RepID=UPI003FA129DC